MSRCSAGDDTQPYVLLVLETKHNPLGLTYDPTSVEQSGPLMTARSVAPHG